MNLKRRLRMNRRVTLFLLAIVFCFYGAAFCGDLIAKQAEFYFNEGVKEQKAGNYEKSETSYAKVALVDPYNAKWQAMIVNNRGVMMLSKGDMPGAEQCFNTALSIDPNFRPAKLNLGFIYEKRRSELESIKYWLKVLNIDLDSLKPKGYILSEIESDSKGKKKK
jgi:tetratricopeptide (TPR) repeat protein